jgi:hypothetical protein
MVLFKKNHPHCKVRQDDRGKRGYLVSHYIKCVHPYCHYSSFLLFLFLMGSKILPYIDIFLLIFFSCQKIVCSQNITCCNRQISPTFSWVLVSRISWGGERSVLSASEGTQEELLSILYKLVVE